MDFEVFQSGDWCVCIYNLVRHQWTVIKNDPESLSKFYEETHNGLYLGFNSVSYDMWIMRAILAGYSPVDMNNWIIVQKRKGWEFDSNLIRKFPMNMYDVYVENGGSLKRLEGYMGHSIKESSVDFNKREPLTEAEWEETIAYCKYDVSETISVMAHRANEFNAKWDLIKEYDMPMSDISRTKAQLSSDILGAIKQEHDDEWELVYPKNMQINKYTFILDWLKRAENHNLDSKLELNIAGMTGIFGFGGLHLCKDNYTTEGHCTMADCESLYPTILIYHNLLSRNCTRPERFKKIYEKRLDLKHQGKKKEQLPLKIVLNSTYGSQNFKYSNLWDPRYAHSCCITGELSFIDLIEKLEDKVELIQANTDAVYFKYTPEKASEEEVKSIISEWEKRYHYKIEYDDFHKIVQSNVNNYLVVMDAKDNNGNYKIKGKGAVVKDLSELDYDLPIVNFAVRAYLLNQIPPEKTVQDNDNLIDFQKIYHVSALYNRALKNCTFSKESYIKPETGRKNTRRVWNGDGEIFEHERTFRVFASKNPNDGALYKQKTGKAPELFAGVPEHCFIENGNIVGKKCSEYIDRLDKDWYIEEAWRRIEQFYGRKVR